MKKLTIVLLLLSSPLLALAQDWADAPLLDQKCHAAGEDADTHTRACLLHCAGSGFGIIDAEGKWLAFDAAGNRLALAAVKKTRKTDHIRVNVSGELKKGALAVSRLAIVD